MTSEACRAIIGEWPKSFTYGDRRKTVRSGSTNELVTNLITAKTRSSTHNRPRF